MPLLRWPVGGAIATPGFETGLVRQTRSMNA